MGIYTRLMDENVREWADRVNGRPNHNRTHCYFCGAKLERTQGRALCLPEAGVEPRYICPSDADKLNEKKWYHFNSNHRSASDAPLGTPKKGEVEHTTIGCEIECVYYDSPSFWTFKVLIERCFNVVEEDDGTVDGEFPTDKMEGGNKLSKMLKKLEKYGFLCFLDHNSVGAHIHVFCACVPTVRNWYNTLFVPLCKYLQEHNNEWITEKFGRTFGSYRNPINEHTDAINHSNFVNTQHGHTLELRLPRIHTANQYLNVVYFWRETVAMLNGIEWIPNNGHNREKRKAQAQAVALDIVKVARKYFGD